MSIYVGVVRNAEGKERFMVGTVWQAKEVKTASGKNIVRCNLSTSKKNGENYTNSSWPTTFVGKAAEKFADLGVTDRDRIKVVSAELSNVYYAEKKQAYLGLTVYDFELFNTNAGENAGDSTGTDNGANDEANDGAGWMNIPDGIDEELPF